MAELYGSVKLIDINIRFGKLEDKKYLIKWLKEPEVLRWYPMANNREIEDAANFWVSFAKQDALLVAEVDGEPCGIVNLYIQPSKKLAHHALLAIIVTQSMRGKGVGTRLLKEIIQLGREKFKLEILMLEVYATNPAAKLYERMGFKEIGIQKNFIFEEGSYLDKRIMQLPLC